MGEVFGVALFGLFMLAIFVGRGAQLRESQKSFDEWVRANGLRVERVERERTWGTGSYVWRVRVLTPAGERREAIVRSGVSVSAPVEVSWREGVFR